MAGLTRNRPNTAPAFGTGTYKVTDNGNTTMKVVVRIRPENETEVSSGAQIIARVLDNHVLVFDPLPENIPSFNALNPFKKRGHLLGRKHKDLRFAFDRVFDGNSTQQQIFEESTKNIAESVLNGINCSVFAYGATGAGKTHTMLGTADSPGVMFHTMMELYRCITKLKDDKIFEVAVSYCEVYNESIRDLLGFQMDGGSLELREDSKHGLVVSNLSRHQPKTAEEILSMLESGNMNRTQHPTDANATSSRSHAVFQVYVHQKPRTAAISAQMTCAKLSLIDLAGSERATVTTNRGARLREGANINKSLLALGNCINALAENRSKSVHVPYRNSKLTRLLKDSLGGNCRTVMIANISPSSLTYEDTYNTLKYADRAKQIKTKVVRNVLNVEFHVSRYRVIVQELQKEIAELKSKLENKNPGKKAATDTTESSRLQGLVRGVYGERSRLRKYMVDLDTQERETLLRICRKERDLHRIDTLTGNEAKKAKLAAKVSALQQQIVETERQKQMVHEYLFSNNEAISRVQREIKTATANLPALCDLMREVVQGRKLETENAHHWRQTKHLLRYVKAQEREIGKTERILLLALEVARKQHTLLKAHNTLTPSVKEMFSNLLHAAEGEKGVAWADLNATSEILQDTSIMGGVGTVGGVGMVGRVGRVEHHGLSMSQQALFDTFLVHASPARRLSLDKHSPATVSKPVAGILSNGTASVNTTTTTSGDRGTDVRSQTSGVDSGVLCAIERKPSFLSDTSSSVASSTLSSRLSSIPDKPRMPTPIEDLSSSCSSINSVYDTRLNTVLNSYHQKPNQSLLRNGVYTKLPSSRSGTPTAFDSPRDTPHGTPEPYLTPMPSLQKLTLTRQNSERYLQQNRRNISCSPVNSTPVASNHYTTVATSGSTSSRMVYSSSSAREDARVHVSDRDRAQENRMPRSSSAFTPLRSSAVLPVPPPSSSLSTSNASSSYSQLVSKAKKLPSVPIPPPRIRTVPHSLPPPPRPLLSSSSSLNMFEDNFVPLPSSRVSPSTPSAAAPKVPPRSPQKSRGAVVADSESCESLKETSIISSHECAASSHSSSSTVKSMESRSHTSLLCKPYTSNSPVVTVETHSTVVSVHPPPSPLDKTQTHHSVSVGVNHSGHKTKEMMPQGVKSRPPAFVPPPPFDPLRRNARQTCTVSSTAKCMSSVSSTASVSNAALNSNQNSKIPSCDRNDKEVANVNAVNGMGQSPLNETFTVEPSKPHPKLHPPIPAHMHSGGIGSGSGDKRRENGVGFKPVPGALKMLYVNSPHALDERERGEMMAKAKKSRGVPNYLQLTKAAASKRVTKLKNKENGTCQAKLPGQSRSIFRTAQPAW